MTRAWVPLADLVDAVLRGQVANSLTIAGSLAVDRLAPRKTTVCRPRIYLIRCRGVSSGRA